MPFIRTSVHKETPSVQRQAIVDGIHQALVDGIGMPADELFNLVTDYDAEQFFSAAPSTVTPVPTAWLWSKSPCAGAAAMP